MKIKTNPLALCAIVILFLSSCTEEFRHKMEVADQYVDDMHATSVTTGVSTNTNSGETQSKTTLTFKGCDNDIEDAERAVVATRVAKEFLGEMKEKDTEGETHLEIIAETAGNYQYTYLFLLDHLRKTDEYLAVAKDAVDACMAVDTVAFDAMKDDEALPDNEMSGIYSAMSYHDSVYGGGDRKLEVSGYFFENLVNDAEREVLTVDYLASAGGLPTTHYTLRIDCETKKVVFIWLRLE